MTKAPRLKSTARIREIIRQKTAERKEFDADDLIAEVLEILQKDREFMIEFVAEQLLPVVRYAVYSTIGLERIGAKGLHTMSSAPTTRSRKGKIKPIPTANWNERVEKGHYMKVMHMTKEDALAAAEIRRKRAVDETKVAVWLEELARPLKWGERISARYTEEHVQAVWEQVEGEYAPAPSVETTSKEVGA